MRTGTLMIRYLVLSAAAGTEDEAEIAEILAGGSEPSVLASGGGRR